MIVRDKAVLSRLSFLKLVGYILRLCNSICFEAGGTHVCLDCGIEVWKVIITNTKLVVSKLN